MSERFTKFSSMQNNLLITLLYAFTKPTEIIHVQFSIMLEGVSISVLKLCRSQTVSKIRRKISVFFFRFSKLKFESMNMFSANTHVYGYIEHRIQGLFLFTRNFYLRYENTTLFIQKQLVFSQQ